MQPVLHCPASHQGKQCGSVAIDGVNRVGGEVERITQTSASEILSMLVNVAAS